MTLKNKNIGLITGLILMTVSFLFYARLHDTFQLLLFCGVLLSLLSYLIILCSKGTINTKSISTMVVVCAILIQPFTSSLFIKASYLIFLKYNKKALTEVNNILGKQIGDVVVLNGIITDKNKLLTKTEIETLVKLRKELGVYMIAKSSDEIYYGLWGFLDNRLGVHFQLKNENQQYLKNHLFGKWFL